MKRRIILAVAVIAVAAVIVLLVLLFSEKSRQNPVRTVSDTPDNKTTESAPVMDDILAVSLNAVRGVVTEVNNRESCTEIVFGVEYIYIRRMDKEYDKGSIEIAFQSSDITLEKGDECILIVSSAEVNNPAFETDADYLLLNPEYNIIRKTDEGWAADAFMQLAGMGTPDKSYDLESIEDVITSNADKFKSYGRLQLVPPV